MRFRNILAQRAFRSMNFDDVQSEYLSQLIQGNDVRVSSSDALLAFNRKIQANKPSLERLFGAAGEGIALFDLWTVTYKAALFRSCVRASAESAPPCLMEKLQQPQSRFSASEAVLLDKLHAFRQKFLCEDPKSRILLDRDDPIRELADLADQRRSELLESFKKDVADVVFYDCPTIEAARLWSYTPAEKLYFRWKRSWLGHAAVEYRGNAETRLSHMMEEHANEPQSLEHLLFKRYRLDLTKMLSEEAIAFLRAHPESSDIESYVRRIFDELSAEHIDNHQQVLQATTNPLSNQLLFPLNVSWLSPDLDPSTERPYKDVMLCSEYVQLSLVNRLLALGEKLKEIGQLQSSAIRIPLGPRDFDLVGPPDLFERWKDYLVPVRNLSDG